MPRPKKRRVGASLDPNYGLLNPLLQLALQNQLGDWEASSWAVKVARG